MDKQLFGAAVAANLIDINEGKKWEAVKSATGTIAKTIRDKAPSVVKGTGAVTNYIGGKVRAAGEGLHKAGESVSAHKSIKIEPGLTSKWGGDKIASAISHVANRGLDATGAVAKGLGTAVKTVGSVPEKVGGEIEKGGIKWQRARETVIANKAKAEADVKSAAEKEMLRKKDLDRIEKIKDAKTDATIQQLKQGGNITPPRPPSTPPSTPPSGGGGKRGPKNVLRVIPGNQTTAPAVP